MADKTEITEPTEHMPIPSQIRESDSEGLDEFWNNDPLTVPEYYIKNSTVESGRSDVTLLLGNTYRDGYDHSRVDLCKLRLIMSHRDFLLFAEFVQKEAAFLTKLYKGQEPGPIYTDEEFDAAFEEIYGKD